MTLSIILLIIIILVVVLLLLFLFYILFPSIKNRNEEEDVLVSTEEKVFTEPELIEYEHSENKAIVLCSCHKNFKLESSVFNQEYTCFMVNSTNGTGTDCKFACIGLGDCARACPQEAISIVNNTAMISSLCTGCGTCIDVCPVNIIQLIPKNTEAIRLCGNKENYLTSCSANQKIEKVKWPDKKDFKIWAYCYKIVRSLIKN